MLKLVLLTAEASRVNAADLRTSLQSQGPALRFSKPDLSLDATERLTLKGGGHLHVTRVSRPFDDPDFDMALVDAGPEETDQVVHHRRHFVIEAEAPSRETAYNLLWAGARVVAAKVGATVVYDPEEAVIEPVGRFDAPRAAPASSAPASAPFAPDPAQSPHQQPEGTAQDAPQGLIARAVSFAMGADMPNTFKSRVTAWGLTVIALLFNPVVGVASAMLNHIFGTSVVRSKSLAIAAIAIVLLGYVVSDLPELLELGKLAAL